MSNSDELELSSGSESAGEPVESESEDDFGVVGGPVQPYRFEPIVPEYYEEPGKNPTKKRTRMVSPQLFWKPDSRSRFP